MIKHADLIHTEMKQQFKRVSEDFKEHPKECKEVVYEEIKRLKEVSR